MRHAAASGKRTLLARSAGVADHVPPRHDAAAASVMGERAAMYNHQRGVGPSPYSSSGSSLPPRGMVDWGVRGVDGGGRPSPVQTYVDRCCDPSLSQPNLPVELELADYVNTKKANTPREAAFAVVDRVNSRMPHVGLLALHLLDILVKNCGYPMHLQIATKEFLNELVKRFPERPPVYPSAVMTRILEMIHEWRHTLCVTSKHKEDLVHIRDMHRLLTYKGYRFAKLDARSAAMLNHDRQIMSPEELEEEDRQAQGAKLQELIRRGTPRDLAQAQELMKVMSGAEPDAQENYAAKTAKELDKLQTRIKLLDDMLDQAKPSDKPVSGDAYDQVASHLRSVQPRLQKWIAQAEQHGTDQLGRYLEVNDRINQALARYTSFCNGEGTGNRAPDLISWDDSTDDAAAAPEGQAPAAGKAPATGKAPAGLSDLDELASLSLGGGSTAPAPAAPQSTAPSAGAPSAPSAPSSSAIDLLGDLDAPAPSNPIRLDTPPVQPFAAQGTNTTTGGAARGAAHGAGGATATTLSGAPATNTNPQPPSTDPFAGLDKLM